MNPLVQRLAAQQLARPRFATPVELVRWMGALQAQDFLGTKWAVALRLTGAPEDDVVQRALDDGAILRIHNLRYTWQLVAPEDVRWMQTLLGPHVLRRAAARHRELGLDAAVFRRAGKIFERALGDGTHLTRDELAERLASSGQPLAHLLGWGELTGLLCSGARRGKQQTYALVDRRVPDAGPRFGRDEAIVELARRYLRGRAPATAADFGWWSGLGTTDARMGWNEAHASLAPARSTAGRPRAWLLPAFDEWLIGYRDRTATVDPAHVLLVNDRGGILQPVIVIDGRVRGTWRRELLRDRVEVALRWFTRPTEAERALVGAAASRYGGYLGLPVTEA